MNNQFFEKYGKAAVDYAKYLERSRRFKSLEIKPHPPLILTSLEKVPDNWDWRKEAPEKINPAGNQGHTGACYLFSTLFAFSDRYAIFTNKSYIPMSTVACASAMKNLKENGDPAGNCNNNNPARDCINCSPMNNGDTSQVNAAINTFGAVRDMGGPNYFLLDFCELGKNHGCVCKKFPKPYSNDCNDDAYQDVISCNLPPLSTYSGDEKFPKKGEIEMVINDVTLDFDRVKNILYTGGPIGISYNFNGWFWRGKWEKTGNIYMTDSAGSTKNYFGYTMDGYNIDNMDKVGFGHSISIVGYGTDNVSFNIKDHGKYSGPVNYVICRNSWGSDFGDNGFFKAAYHQKLNGFEIMKGVWGETSLIEFNTGKLYKCISPGQPCVQAEDGTYDTPDECAKNCQASKRNFRCVNHKFCREDPEGSFTSASICKAKCGSQKPTKNSGNTVAVIVLSIFIILGGIAVVFLGFLIYKRVNRLKSRK